PSTSGLPADIPEPGAFAGDPRLLRTAMAEPKPLHLVPIGGTAMPPLAALLAEEGHRVSGSALDLYPPMSTLLDSLQIPVARGFAPEHVPAGCDCVVVGNAALRAKFEADETRRRVIT